MSHQGTIPLPPEFDWAAYVGHPANGGLRSFSEAEAVYHYQMHGKAEGRICNSIDCRDSFLRLIPADATLLEIGPFCWPAFRTAEHRVRYLDAHSTDELRNKARQVEGADLSNVPNIDYLWTGEPYKSLIRDQTFDIAYSSHNIEHQTCLVSHLNDVASVLREHGRYFLVIPDKRYCFDHYLPESTMVDILDAFITRRRRHSLRNLIRDRVLLTHNDRARHWMGDHGPDPRTNQMSGPATRGILDQLETIVRRMQIEDPYIDTHAWQFTPDIFRHLVDALCAAGLVPFQTERVYQTLFGSFEFYAVLRAVQR